MVGSHSTGDDVAVKGTAMPQKAAPHRARIIVPVDGVTAARLQSEGFTIEYPWNRTYARATLEFEPISAFIAEVSDYVDAYVSGDEIILNLGVGPRLLVDETPPIPADVPGLNTAPLWPKPEVKHGFHGTVHLRATDSADKITQAILDWLHCAPPVDDAVVRGALSAWSAQAELMLRHATQAVESLRSHVVSDEWHGLVKRLDRLAHHVRHARDGGSDPMDPDFEEDDFGERFLKPAHWYVNEAYEEVLEAYGRTAAAGNDRSRGEIVQAELSRVVSFHFDSLPERYRRACALELLPTLLGAARRELLSLVWPEWEYLAEGEVVRPIANPSMEALDSLGAERAVDGEDRPWPHNWVTLSWLTSGQRPVLVSSFLGKTILKDLQTTGTES